MVTYECNKCGMSVNATCGKCNEALVNDYIIFMLWTRYELLNLA